MLCNNSENGENGYCYHVKPISPKSLIMHTHNHVDNNANIAFLSASLSVSLHCW